MEKRNLFSTAFMALSLALMTMSPVYALPNGVLAPNQVDTHGPLVDKITFSAISSDPSLYSTLAADTIQGPEWTLSAGSFLAAASNPNLYANKTTEYSLSGLSFNMLRPVVNNTHFRRAMIYLLDYAFIQNTVLSGIAGSAQPDLFYSGDFPTLYNPNVRSYQGPNYDLAVQELKDAGLTESNTSAVALSQITWLYKGHPFVANFIYRSDDPLRTSLALHLINQASKIGLTFNAQGERLYLAMAGVIFGPSLAAVIKPGVYNATTGYNSPPVFNYSAAKTTDTWDIYTYGWTAGPEPTWVWAFFNSADVGTTGNFLNYYNKTMDYDTNAVLHATTIQAATAASQKVAADFMNDLPYIQCYYLNNLYAVYLKGWTGYADLPSTGPTENGGSSFSGSGGLYYTLLNVHPTGQASGGTFNLAIHNIPDSLDPLYITNWVWQVDLWLEIYDSPVARNPAIMTTPLSLINWMTTGYSVQPFNGDTGTGTGWFQEQGAQGVANKLVNGQVITVDFYKNITFTDHVPMNAYDYNFSLWASNLAGSLPDNGSPFGYDAAGPTGLWATYINPSNPYELKMYINSSAVWNVLDMIVPVMPLHIFKYINPDLFTTASTVMSTYMPWGQATAASRCGTPCTYLAEGVTQASVPTWLNYLPNLEVGTGPFWLRAYSDSTGTGELDMNVNFYRSAWQKTGDIIASGTSSYTFSTNIQESIYNAGSSSLGGVAPGQTGAVGIANATGTVTVLKPDGTVVQSASLSGGTNGQYSANFNTGSWANGHYELVTNATYSFLGLHRTWWQATGLCIGASCAAAVTTTASATTTPSVTTTAVSTTTASTTSATTVTSTISAAPAPDYTRIIVSSIVVALIAILGVAVFLRRGRTTKMGTTIAGIVQGVWLRAALSVG